MELDLRFFEIYRNPEYLLLLGKGALLSAGLTVLAALFGLILAFLLAAVRFGRVPVLEWVAAGNLNDSTVFSLLMLSASHLPRESQTSSAGADVVSCEREGPAAVGSRLRSPLFCDPACGV